MLAVECEIGKQMRQSPQQLNLPRLQEFSLLFFPFRVSLFGRGFVLVPFLRGPAASLRSGAVWQLITFPTPRSARTQACQT